MSYFNLDDIMSDSRSIPCTFAVNARGLNDLDRSADPSRLYVRLECVRLSFI
jgi:hypothetical protein